MASAERGKEAVAQRAVEGIGSERRIALGTGSTAAYMVRALAKRFPGGSGFTLVASSRATEKLARSLGLGVRSLEGNDRFEMMLDGADEVTADLDLTKGGGGALFREKFLARLSDRLVIMVDSSKLVDRVGTRHPIPIEVVPFAREVIAHRLSSQGFSVAVRADARGTPVRTDNGNEILDLRPAAPVEDARALNERLRQEPGVVETGLFTGLAHEVLVGYPDGRVEVRSARGVGPRRT